MGCILFGMLFGELPFNGKNNKEITENVVACNYTIPSNPKISPEATDILSNLLKKEPELRIKMN